MKIILFASLKMKDDIWSLFFVEKILEFDNVPRVGDKIKDNDLSFEVESITFNISKKCAEVYLEDYEIENDIAKKEVLKIMEDSGWYYRDPIVYTLSEL
jgi:hypothetical protein